MFAIMKHVELVVPEDAPTLASALAMALPWQRVTLRRGEHLVDAKVSGDPGSSVLRVASPINLHGEQGAILRGTLILDAVCAGGSIEDLRLEDGGDCCLRCEGGTWTLNRLRLRCAHGAAVLACNQARVALTDCVLGGEGDDEMGKHVMLSAYGSVQVQGLAKRACYAMVLGSCHCRGVALRDAPMLRGGPAHRASLARAALRLPHPRLHSGIHRRAGSRPCARACTLHRRPQRCKLWADADRPRAFVWGEGNVSHARRVDAADDEESDDDDTEDACAEIQPPQRPRGMAEGESSDSDDSLEEQEFANMEELMAQLDEAELAR